MLRRILVPLDGSALAEEAIGMAAAIARASKAELDLLMVHEPLLPGNDPTWTEKQIAAERKYLTQIGEELQSGAGVVSHQTLLRGRPDELIAVRAADCSADLIVMTTHGRTGWARAWMGSVADAVARGSNIPVLMLRPAEQRPHPRALRWLPRRILVPLDGSAVAMEILGPVSDLARVCDSAVDLLRVVAPVPLITHDLGMPFAQLPNAVDSEATEAVVREANAELRRDAAALRQAGVRVGGESLVVSRFTAQAIADNARARGADFIAMGTHGRGRSRLLVGSITEKVRRITDLPLLLHRPRFARIAEPEMTARAVAEQLPALAWAGAES